MLDKTCPAAPNRIWVSDITYIPMADGSFSYLAMWMDWYSRKIIGWQLEAHMQEALIVAAFKKALVTRVVQQGMIVHSDQGGQYEGKQFRKLLDQNNLLQSMSRAD